MKTKKIRRANRWLPPLVIAFVFLVACQKKINNNEAALSQLRTNSVSAENESSAVATDWYKLMLNMIRNTYPVSGPNARMF